jgi:hypothetical protein
MTRLSLGYDRRTAIVIVFPDFDPAFHHDVKTVGDGTFDEEQASVSSRFSHSIKKPSYGGLPQQHGQAASP